MPKFPNVKKIFGLLIICIVFGIFAIRFINAKYQIAAVDIPSLSHQSASQSNTKKPDSNTTTPTTYKLPANLLLKVPFTPQAPTANWDQLHNEACEEASAIMANEYFSGNKATNLDPNLVELEISKLTDYENKTLGYYLDITSAETAQMIEQVYGLKTKMTENFTADDLKNELSQNHLVLISEYGRALNNPNYKRPGPIHHMLLIKGFNSAGFITNDSGTKNGLNYFYDFKTLYDAAADWNHTTQNVDLNKKIAIVVWDAKRP